MTKRTKIIKSLIAIPIAALPIAAGVSLKTLLDSSSNVSSNDLQRSVSEKVVSVDQYKKLSISKDNPTNSVNVLENANGAVRNFNLANTFYFSKPQQILKLKDSNLLISAKVDSSSNAYLVFQDAETLDTLNVKNEANNGWTPKIFFPFEKAVIRGILPISGTNVVSIFYEDPTKQNDPFIFNFQYNPNDKTVSFDEHKSRIDINECIGLPKSQYFTEKITLDKYNVSELNVPSTDDETKAFLFVSKNNPQFQAFVQDFYWKPEHVLNYNIPSSGQTQKILALGNDIDSGFLAIGSKDKYLSSITNLVQSNRHGLPTPPFDGNINFTSNLFQELNNALDEYGQHITSRLSNSQLTNLGKTSGFTDKVNNILQKIHPDLAINSIDGWEGQGNYLKLEGNKVTATINIGLVNQKNFNLVIPQDVANKNNVGVVQYDGIKYIVATVTTSMNVLPIQSATSKSSYTVEFKTRNNVQYNTSMNKAYVNFRFEKINNWIDIYATKAYADKTSFEDLTFVPIVDNPMNLGYLKTTIKGRVWDKPIKINNLNLQNFVNDIYPLNTEVKPFIFRDPSGNEDKTRVIMFLNTLDKNNSPKILCLSTELTYNGDTKNYWDSPTVSFDPTSNEDGRYQIHWIPGYGLNSVVWSGSEAILNVGTTAIEPGKKYGGQQKLIKFKNDNWTNSHLNGKTIWTSSEETIVDLAPLNSTNEQQLFTVAPITTTKSYNPNSDVSPVILQSWVNSPNSYLLNNTTNSLAFQYETTLKNSLYLVLRGVINSVQDLQNNLNNIKIQKSASDPTELTAQNNIKDILNYPVVGTNIIFRNPQQKPDGSFTVDIYIDKYADASGVHLQEKLIQQEAIVNGSTNWTTLKQPLVGQTLQPETNQKFESIFNGQYQSINIYKELWDNNAYNHALESKKQQLQDYVNAHKSEFVKLDLIQPSNPNITITNITPDPQDSSIFVAAADILIDINGVATTTHEPNFLKFKPKTLTSPDWTLPQDQSAMGKDIISHEEWYNHVFGNNPIYKYIATWNEQSTHDAIKQKLQALAESNNLPTATNQQQLKFFKDIPSVQRRINTPTIVKQGDKYNLGVSVEWFIPANSNPANKDIVLATSSFADFVVMTPTTIDPSQNVTPQDKIVTTADPLFNTIFDLTANPGLKYDVVWQTAQAQQLIKDKIKQYVLNQQNNIIKPIEGAKPQVEVKLEPGSSTNTCNVKLSVKWVIAPGGNNPTNNEIVVAGPIDVNFNTFRVDTFDGNAQFQNTGNVINTSAPEFTQIFDDPKFKYTNVWKDLSLKATIESKVKAYIEKPEQIAKYFKTNDGVKVKINSVTLVPVQGNDNQFSISVSASYILEANKSPTGQEIVLNTVDSKTDFVKFELNAVNPDQLTKPSVNAPIEISAFNDQNQPNPEFTKFFNDPVFKYSKVWANPERQTEIINILKKYLVEDVKKGANSEYFNQIPDAEIKINSVSIAVNPTNENQYSVTVNYKCVTTKPGGTEEIVLVPDTQKIFFNFTLNNPDVTNVTIQNVVGQTVNATSDEFKQIFNSPDDIFVTKWEEQKQSLETRLQEYLNNGDNINQFINQRFDAHPIVTNVEITKAGTEQQPNLFTTNVTVNWVVPNNIVIATKTINNFLKFNTSPTLQEFKTSVVNNWTPTIGNWVDWNKEAIAKTLNLPQFKSLLPKSITADVTKEMILANASTGSFPIPGQDGNVIVSNISIKGAEQKSFFVNQNLNFNIKDKYQVTSSNLISFDANSLSLEEFRNIFGDAISVWGVDWSSKPELYGNENPNIVPKIAEYINKNLDSFIKNKATVTVQGPNNQTTTYTTQIATTSGQPDIFVGPVETTTDVSVTSIKFTNYFSQNYEFVQNNNNNLEAQINLTLKKYNQEDQEKIIKVKIEEQVKQIFTDKEGDKESKIPEIQNAVITYLNKLKESNELPLSYCPDNDNFSTNNTIIDVTFDDVNFTANVVIKPKPMSNIDPTPSFSLSEMSFEFNIGRQQFKYYQWWELALIVIGSLLLLILLIVIISLIAKHNKDKNAKKAKIKASTTETVIDPLDEVL